VQQSPCTITTLPRYTPTQQKHANTDKVRGRNPRTICREQPSFSPRKILLTRLPSDAPTKTTREQQHPDVRHGGAWPSQFIHWYRLPDAAVKWRLVNCRVPPPNHGLNSCSGYPCWCHHSLLNSNWFSTCTLERHSASEDRYVNVHGMRKQGTAGVRGSTKGCSSVAPARRRWSRL